MRKALAVISGLILALTVCACAGKQKKILFTQESQVKLRSIQSRVFDTTDRNLMLRTVIATLQDLGLSLTMLMRPSGPYPLQNSKATCYA
jgi:hypothetical protein